MGVYVMASDLHPPGDSSRNLWHRSIPLMTEVTQGGVESVTVAPPPHTLLLGHTVCFVGEWCGDTGDPAFLHQLQSHFTLLERRALPNWSDTSHELTVWQKRSEPMFEAGGVTGGI
ncbi:hypothetical protein CVIRNUC_006768 [Coccomyxa viridis]|uniref:Uncharacterized protein n=1 Tax=Coccomyxa viridis TaxID=1274662 RepID=A0AAV1I877_9CHLO|nr:hypothetical protein CVIRNUC_006768 [Coccomyxa viridis]